MYQIRNKTTGKLYQRYKKYYGVYVKNKFKTNRKWYAEKVCNFLNLTNNVWEVIYV